MAHFYDPMMVKRQEIAEGVSIRTIWGEKVMMSYIECAPHAVVPMHSHPHEQTGMVLEGEFDFTIGDDTRRLRTGEAYVIPGGVEHGLVALEGWSLALDIFSPVREEYKGEGMS